MFAVVKARIDVVAIGDEIVGYEIKSERDSLSRLTSQLAFYGDALPRLNIVVGSCHLNNIIESLATLVRAFMSLMRTGTELTSYESVNQMRIPTSKS